MAPPDQHADNPAAARDDPTGKSQDAAKSQQQGSGLQEIGTAMAPKRVWIKLVGSHGIRSSVGTGSGIKGHDTDAGHH